MRTNLSILAVAAIAVLAPSSNFAADPPPRLKPADTIDAAKELQRIGSLEGKWEGVVEIVHDPVAVRRDAGPLKLEITLTEDAAKVSLLDKEGANTLPEDAVVKGGEATGTVIVFYAGGSDTFAEYWVFVLSHVDRDAVHADVMRAVHNANAKSDSPWRSFSMFGQAKMKRMK